MSTSPVISKIRCCNPNKKNSRILNRNHLVYIGTREGVDLTPIQESDNDLYLKYIAERPKSNGLFGNIDHSDPIVLGNYLSDLTKEGQNIYRGIISLSEADALNLGYDKKEKWVSLMKNNIPDIGNQFGIPIDKLNWVAAVHMEKSHPHVHYMFWHTDRVVKSPFIHVSVQNKCRSIISADIFREEREQSIIEKTAKRDLLVELGKDFMKEELSFILNNKIPGRMNHQDIETITGKLINLLNQLPEHGRLSYKLLPPEQKVLVHDVTNELLKLQPLKKEYDSFIELNKTISSSYANSKEKETYLLNVAREDIEKRISNIVLKTCKCLLQEQDKVFELFKERIEEQNPKVFENKDLIPFDSSEFSDPLKKIEEDVLNSYPIEREYIEDNFFDQNKTSETKYSSTNKYICDWSSSYKEALNLIYSKDRNIPLALNLLENEAVRNNVLATIELGKLYEKGIGVNENSELSQNYYKKSFEGFQSLLNDSSRFNSKMNHYFHYRIGKLYESGKGIELNYEEAIKHYEIASIDNKYAQYSLGNMYLHHKGIDVNEDNETDVYYNALLLFEKSANKSNPYASFMLAKCSEQRNVLNLTDNNIYKNYQESYRSFKQMILENENDDLEYKTAVMLKEGKGVETDTDAAMFHFEKAIELKNENAKYKICDMLLEKDSKYYDPNRALIYLKEISEKETFISKYALYKLGCLYLDEDSPFYNLSEAITILKKSEQEGNSIASYKLGSIYSDESIPGYNIELAIHHFKKAAEKGNDLAEYKLGKIYYNLNDIDNSIKYLVQSSNKGNQHAQYQLGKIYSDKSLKQFDITSAIKQFKASCDQGNIYSMIALGNIYSDESDPNYNIDHAIKYFKKAAENGSDYADYKLGKIYYDLNDITNSLKYLTKSSDNGNEHAQYQLGKLFSNKDLQQYDIHLAIKHFQTSYSQGNLYSLAELGNIYLWGKHENIKNVELGKSMLLEADEKGHPWAGEALKLYDTIKESQLNSLYMGIGYNLINSVSNLLSNSKNAMNLDLKRNLKFRTRSKEAWKDAEKKELYK